jgi:enediyne biosynthesis protein E4
MWKPFLVASPLMAGVLFAAPIVFTDVTGPAGLIAPLEGIMGHGAAFGDVDGDGLPDLYVGGFADRPDAEYEPAAGPMRNVLLRNTGGLKFEIWNQDSVRFFARTSGAVFADLDNDGDVDLYVANNTKGKSSSKTEPQRTAQLAGSKMFRNDGGTLVDVSEASGACPASLRTARNIGVMDYDSDGLPDLLVLEFSPRIQAAASSRISAA